MLSPGSSHTSLFSAVQYFIYKYTIFYLYTLLLRTAVLGVLKMKFL